MIFLKIDDLKFIRLEKAKDITKLIKKQIVDKNGHIKTVYVKNKETIKIRMRTYANNLFNNYFAMGFKERIGNIQETNILALKSSEEFENKIVNKNLEHCGAFNSKGKLIFTKKGEYDKIEFYKSEVDIFRNSEIFTHNHPEDKSFSMEDIFMAISFGIKELRVISPNYIYSLKFSHKQKSNNFFELFNKYLSLFSEIDKYEYNTNKELKNMENFGFITSEQRNIIKDEKMLKDITDNENFKKEYNIIFNKIRR